jgi:predicted ATPase
VRSRSRFCSKSQERRRPIRAIALAFLDVLRTLASGPIVLAIDDIQWVDAASAQVLQFGLRRLEEEPVAVLATVRIAGGPPPPYRRAATSYGRDDEC